MQDSTGDWALIARMRIWRGELRATIMASEDAIADSIEAIALLERIEALERARSLRFPRGNFG